MPSPLFEELDYRQTVLGELILRRRRILKLDRDVVEVILNDEHLMSDMFPAWRMMQRLIFWWEGWGLATRQRRF